MRKLILLIYLFASSLIVSAQPFGNEWIDYSQKYYYFKVSQTGIYRIDYNTLLNAGVPITSINPKNIQIFGKHQEQYIRIEGEADNVFDPGDYIEFYAERNDGWQDTAMYGGPENMPDLHYSLFNDTLRYYITWNNSTANRRIIDETDINYAGYTPLNFVLKTNYTKYTDHYLIGENQDGSSSSYLTAGEGWFYYPYNGVIPGQEMMAVNVPTPYAYTGPGAPDAIAITSSASASNAISSTQGNHHLQVRYGNSNQIAFDSVFFGYKLIKDTFAIVPSELGATNTNFEFHFINDLSALTDYQAVGSVTVTYPHNLNFNSATTYEFTVPFNSTELQSRLDITGFTGSNPILYVLEDTVKRITVSGAPGNYQALVPNLSTGLNSTCFLSADGSVNAITSLFPVNGNGSFTDYEAMNIDSAYLILTHESLLTESGVYGNYRSSAAGGSYNVLVIDVEQLYDQYGGGVQKHSIALHRFCDHLIKTWTTSPTHLFIIGKGIREATESSNGTFHGTRKDPLAFQNSLVPSYGYPSSDVLITAAITSGTYTPAISTGRLAANTPSDVTIYLNKVIEYEAAQQNPTYTYEDKAWMKHILHFGGGSDASEQATFGFYLKQFEKIAVDSLFGGYVDTYLKQTSSPINPIDFSDISASLADGVSLMTFFGHASSAGFDQNIDVPANWNNQGKYPFLLGNGCYAGDIFQPTSISNSEEFVLIPNRGTIAFLSTSKAGFSGPLYSFSDKFYKQFSYINYGNTSGNQIKAVIDSIELTSTIGFHESNVAMQMTMHGDPGIRLNSHKEPEFIIRTQDVFYNPAQVSLGTDTMDVNVVVGNLGKSSVDSIKVELIRHFPNGNGDSIYTQMIAGERYLDTAVFRIPVLHNLSTGINIFDASVDLPSLVTETYDEISNNQTTSTLFINSNGIRPVYPYEFAIVPDSSLTLIASTLNPLASVRSYVLELDTTDLYNSPFKRTLIVTAAGGAISFDCADLLNATSGLPDPLIFSDSTVYFWRVSPDSTVQIWEESSFQYIKGQIGWGQAHFFQFKNNTHQSLNYDRTTRSWIWDESYRMINCDVYAFANNSVFWQNTLWELDGAMQEYDGCGSPLGYPAIHVAVIDPLTLEAWTTADHSYGNTNQMGICRSRPERYFIFHQNHAAFPYSMDSLIGFYNNYIPVGHYVLFYTYNYAAYTDWQPQYFSFFQSIGADSVYSGRPHEAFIYLTQKGNEANYNNFVADTTTDALVTIADTLKALDYQGNMIAETAGPAARWDALYWEQEAKESPTDDSTQLVLVGIKLNGDEDTLINTSFTPLDSIINLQSVVDASIYPFVRLSAFFQDDQLFTPAQTQRWQLLYQPMPEAAINPPAGFYFSAVNDSIQEGQNIDIAIAIENISPWHMDSLLVHYWIEDENRVLHYQSYPRQDSLLSGEILYDTVSISSAGYPGLNSLWVEVNPVPLFDTTGNFDQLEQYHFNNYIQIPFFVSIDEMNPILDVTFDGIHILNGDIVSGQPIINITLKDENPYMVMNEVSDTSHFAVYLTDPIGNQKRIYFNQGVTPIMNFTPSTGPNDKFKIDYNPTLLMDGKYQLLIQASDKSGNESGDFDYRIDFEVINSSTITEVMNYPNPFSTKTHFVFTLTGSTIPDYMKIQIMTISGKIVREIMVEELGPIHIGRNITEYAWDGRDEFGDLLANGIYLYRVITKMNGEAVEKRESGADAYFKQGFGKMQLMR